MSEQVAAPDETLRLTDEGLELPEMLRGYVGSYTIRTADVTGSIETTDHGLPDADFYDGVLAIYPDDDGDYNSHLEAGLLSFETSDDPETVFEIVDERTEDGDA